MPKIDLSNLKKSKKKRPWASIDELLNPSLGNEISVTREVNSTSPETQHTADVKSPELDQSQTKDLSSVNPIFCTGDISKRLLLDSKASSIYEADTQIAAKSDNIAAKPLLETPILSIEPEVKKSSIETLSRLNTESIEIVDRLSLDSIQKRIASEPISIDSVQDSVNKSIQTSIHTKPANPRLPVPTTLTSSLTSLVKIGSKQFTILLYLFKTIGESGENLTKEISASELSNIAKTSIGSARSAINELIAKNLIQRKIFSKAGWTVYEFPESSFQLVLKYTQNITDPGLYRFYIDLSPQIYIESASSKYVGNKDANTIQPEHVGPPSNFEEPQNWSELREVDFSQLQQWGIKSTVVETFKKNKWIIERFDLEDFIERFHRYMTEPQYSDRRAKIKNPYSFFLGSIKDIANGEPHSLCDIKTDYEIQKEVALKNRSKQLEDLERLVQDQQNRMNQLLEAKFNSWVETLSQDQQTRLVPTQAMAKPGSIAYRQLLKAYFTENVWSQNEQLFLNGPRA